MARRDRSVASTVWYHCVRYFCAILATVRHALAGDRSGQCSRDGRSLAGLPTMSVSSTWSFWESRCGGRSTTWRGRPSSYPILGWFIRSVGAFPIQREGMGASGMKETLRRLKAGGIVTLFPEGTRSQDGQLGKLKPGIAVLVERVGVPVVPAGLAGMFEIWPRSRLFPIPHPIRIHYGRPIYPDELAGLDTEAITALIRARMEESFLEASRALRERL